MPPKRGNLRERTAGDRPPPHDWLPPYGRPSSNDGSESSRTLTSDGIDLSSDADSYSRYDTRENQQFTGSPLTLPPQTFKSPKYTTHKVEKDKIEPKDAPLPPQGGPPIGVNRAPSIPVLPPCPQPSGLREINKKYLLSNGVFRRDYVDLVDGDIRKEARETLTTYQQGVETYVGFLQSNHEREKARLERENAQLSVQLQELLREKNERVTRLLVAPSDFLRRRSP